LEKLLPGAIDDQHFSEMTEINISPIKKKRGDTGSCGSFFG
jgi:hypothetical protein